jgi:hypothetical protein
MALYTITKQPQLWQSAHRPIEYEIDFQKRELTAVTDVSGKARFDLAVAYSINAPVGALLYVVSGIYKGYHRITQVVTSTQYLTDTAFIGTAAGIDIKRAVVAPISVLSGYNVGEDPTLEPLFPLAAVATFSPEPTLDGFLRFDVSAYVSATFNTDIEPPIIGIDYRLFRRYRLQIGLALTSDYRMAANASIDDLSSYVDTGRPLSPEKKPQYQNCNKNLISQIVLENIITSYATV